MLPHSKQQLLLKMSFSEKFLISSNLNGLRYKLFGKILQLFSPVVKSLNRCQSKLKDSSRLTNNGNKSWRELTSKRKLFNAVPMMFSRVNLVFFKKDFYSVSRDLISILNKREVFSQDSTSFLQMIFFKSFLLVLIHTRFKMISKSFSRISTKLNLMITIED